MARRGSTAGLGMQADGNGDGIVNVSDFPIWRNNLGNSTTPALTEAAGEQRQEPPTRWEPSRRGSFATGREPLDREGAVENSPMASPSAMVPGGLALRDGRQTGSGRRPLDVSGGGGVREVGARAEESRRRLLIDLAVASERPPTRWELTQTLADNREDEGEAEDEALEVAFALL